MTKLKLDILGMVREAYGGAWTHMGEMLRLIWLPGLLYLATAVISMFVDPAENLLTSLLLNIVALFLWPIIAVTWHRFVLIGDAPSGSFHLHFGRREARFLMVSFFLFLLLLPGLLLAMAGATIAQEQPQSTTGSLLGFIGMLLILVSVYFFVRLSLLLPAAAVDDPVDARLVLERTRGNFWRMVAVFALIVLPIALCVILLASLMQAMPALAILGAAAFALVSIFFAIVNVAVLSVVYRELVGPPGTQAPDFDGA
ncbi:MAG: hypothetical protein CVT72_07805 [Alphaproteobacteria bacterium HGW-Alphaproteobacteria-11]|nr:MAG: hypothetical protein CVT72_07805 [Alphaproteobacteria bacterium HGW-Alphaproteobacteria-11]